MSGAAAYEQLPIHRTGGCVRGSVRALVTLPRPLARWRQVGVLEVIDNHRFRKDLVQLLPRLRRFAITLCGQGADSDDLVQMACERAMKRSEQWMPGTRLDSWLFTMMRNLWVSELRSRRVRTGAGQIDATDTDELATEVGAAEILQGNQIAAMIRSLPEGMAATLLLVSVEGHSYQEAADVLDIPIGTVMSRMSKARQLMRERLAAAGGVTVR